MVFRKSGFARDDRQMEVVLTGVSVILLPGVHNYRFTVQKLDTSRGFAFSRAIPALPDGR
jgi:hypothetical protein